MKVLWTDSARDDLADIGNYIGPDNPARAVTFIDEIIACGESLCAHPRAFPLVPRYERAEIRRRMFGRYLIFYRVTGIAIEIIHVLHGARDYMRLLGMQDFDDG